MEYQEYELFDPVSLSICVLALQAFSQRERNSIRFTTMMEGLNFEPFLRASPACTDCMSVQVLVVIAHLSLALKDTLMLGVKL